MVGENGGNNFEKSRLFGSLQKRERESRMKVYGGIIHKAVLFGIWKLESSARA